MSSYTESSIVVQSIFVFVVLAFLKTTRVHNQEYDLKLVDTAGQDEHSILPPHYSMDVHGYVLVYSITSPKSFEIIQIIYDKLLDMTGKVQWVTKFFIFLFTFVITCILFTSVVQRSCSSGWKQKGFTHGPCCHPRRRAQVSRFVESCICWSVSQTKWGDY